MSSLKSMHVWAPGTNCQTELGVACEMVGMEVEIIHIRELMRHPGRVHEADFLALPGGFSYGDDIASGRLLANQLKTVLDSELDRFLGDGKLIFGVCNGFQTLVKAGFLPGPPHPTSAASIYWNDSGRFECRWVHIHPHPENPSPWTQGLPVALAIPIAHAEGKFVAADDVLQDLEANHQIAFTYCNPDGTPAIDYPALPSGSLLSIAGITDRSGQILGMMPHPERYTLTTHAPNWTHGGLHAESTCLPLFANAASWLRSHVGAGV